MISMDLPNEIHIAFESRSVEVFQSFFEEFQQMLTPVLLEEMLKNAISRHDLEISRFLVCTALVSVDMQLYTSLHWYAQHSTGEMLRFVAKLYVLAQSAEFISTFFAQLAKDEVISREFKSAFVNSFIDGSLRIAAENNLLKTIHPSMIENLLGISFDGVLHTQTSRT